MGAPSTIQKWFSIALFPILLASTPVWSQSGKPVWWGNNIGKDQIVLPGFEPIVVEGQGLMLGMGRKYHWKDSYLPVEMKARNEPLVTKSVLTMIVNGSAIEPKPGRISFPEKSDHHVVVKAEGAVNDALKMSVTTRVEYDGVAMVEVRLTPTKPVMIDRLHFVANIQANPWTKMLAFDAKEIGDRENRVVRDPVYRGGFLNAISIVDGARSFWWFQDNAEGWVGNPADMTAVSNQNGSVEIRQKLIEGKTLLSKEKVFRFNFMVTPVKGGSGNIRQNRVARSDGAEEGKHQGVHLWWTTAFAHQVLPYVVYPPNVEARIPQKDRDAYPGLQRNREILAQYRKQDIERLPYFSAHVLNYLDPAYQQFKDSWEVHPRIVWNRLKYDDPFTATRNDAFLTHRAEGYTDYLLYRYSEVIDQLGMEGLYFDQGGVRLSSNPLNGQWLDANGKAQGSTDILALRQFHKRLATLFYLKGKKGLIVSHNSNAAILPAYSFVTTMLQGEEFNERLINYDYIQSITLDEVRSRIGSSAMGVPSLWLEVIFAENSRLNRSKRPYPMSKAAWHASPYYEDAYLNFMTLALLHDIPTWAYSELKTRNKIMQTVDWVNPESAQFVGYWNYPPSLFENKVFHSHYRSKDGKKILVVIANLGESTQQVDLEKLKSSLELKPASSKCNWSIDPMWSGDRTRGNIPVKAKRFELLPLVCK